MANENRDQQNHTDAYWVKVDAVVNLILENDRYLNVKRAPELTEMVMKRWGIDTRMAQKYIKEAKKEIKKLGQRDKEKAFIKAMRDREFLYRKAISPSFIFSKDLRDENGKLILVADLKLALEVVKDRDEIHGLYEKTVNVKGELKNTVNLDGISTTDLLTLIDELKKLNTSES